MLDKCPRLTREELISLRRLAMGTASVFIPIGHLDTFRRLQLTQKAAGGDVITERGIEQTRLALSAAG